MVLIAFGVLAIAVGGSVLAQVGDKYVRYEEQKTITYSTEPFKLDKTVGFSSVEYGSKISGVTITLTTNDLSDSTCFIELEDNVLEPVTISDMFPCKGTSVVVLNEMGKDAVENNITNGELAFNVRNIQTKIPIQFMVLSVDISYDRPTYFAKVENGIVTQVIIASPEFIASGSAGDPNLWVQTNPDESLRKNFAGVGYTYDAIHDMFIPPQPYASWVLDEVNGKWNPPLPYPADGGSYIWNEDTKSWDKVA